MHSMTYHVIFWQQQWSLTKAWYGVEMILPFWHCRDPWWRDQSPGCCKWKSLLLSPPAQRPGDFFLHCSQSLGGSDCGRNVHWFVQWRPWCQFPLVHQLYIFGIYQTKKPTNNNQTKEKATIKTPTNKGKTYHPERESKRCHSFTRPVAFRSETCENKLRTTWLWLWWAQGKLQTGQMRALIEDLGWMVDIV